MKQKKQKYRTTECHKYDPNNQRPDNIKKIISQVNKFVDKDYHTWMKIGDTTGSFIQTKV